MKYAFIQSHLSEYSVESCCLVLEVSRSGYYDWLERPMSSTTQRMEELKVKIKKVHEENRCVYGSRRVCAALKAEGETVCVNTVTKGMKELEIRAKIKKKFVPCTTDSRHCNPVAENILDRDFTAELPNQKWATDITYIPTGEGWLYLAGVTVTELAFQEDRRLVDGRPHENGPGERRAADGCHPPASRCGSAAPQRPGRAVRQRRLPAIVAIESDAIKHERQGKLLGQRLCRELLGHAQNRTGPSRAVRHPPAGQAIDL